MTVKELLSEQNIERASDDALDVDPSSPLSDGETIAYRAAVPVTLVVDGKTRTILTSAETVGEVLAQQDVVFDFHDRVMPVVPAAVTADDTIRVDHVSSWVERVTKAVAPPTEHLISFKLAVGHVKVMKNGTPGEREISYRVTRRADRSQSPRHVQIASRIVRKPQPRVVAAGIGDYSSLAAFAQRGFDGTIKLAKDAISMVATAYTRELLRLFRRDPPPGSTPATGSWRSTHGLSRSAPTSISPATAKPSPATPAVPSTATASTSASTATPTPCNSDAGLLPSTYYTRR